MRRFVVKLLVTFILFSCGNKKSEIYIHSASEAALAEKFTLDILKEVLLVIPDFLINQAYTGSLNIAVLSDPEITSSNYPKNISINYGEGVVGFLGKIRSGVLSVSINAGNINTQDLEVSFESYVYDGSQIFGNITYKYDSISKGYEGKYNGEGISIVNPNGTMKLSGIFSIDKISTSGTTTIADDQFNFNCTTSGIDFLQTSFTHQSVTDHRVKFDCTDFVVSGTSNITPNNKESQTINFGSGKCDSQGTIESDGETKNFSF
jgi:hypothetical protein